MPKGIKKRTTAVIREELEKVSHDMHDKEAAVKQAKADYDEAKMREQMKENRQNVRSAFNSVAKELEAFGNRYIQNAVSSSLDRSISELDDNIKEIRSTRQDRSQSYRQLEMLQGDCVSLIQEIHASVSE